MSVARPHLRLKSLTLQQMPHVGPQFRRALNAEFSESQSDKLCVAASAMKHNVTTAAETEVVDTAMIAPLLAGFTQINTKAEKVNMPASYDPDSGIGLTSFVLVVEYYYPTSRNPSVYYIAGYSDSPCPAEGAPINPHMDFTINSIHEFRETPVYTEHGHRLEYKLTSSLQVLQDNDYAGFGSQPQHRLCARDIVSNVSALELMRLSPMEVFDMRTVQTQHPYLANYADNDPTNWAQRMLEANAIVINGDFLNPMEVLSHQEHLHQLMSALDDRHAQRNPFISALSLSNDGMLRGRFDLRDLMYIDPGCFENIIVLSPPQVETNRRRNSLEESTANTIAAHYITNSVPALMAKYGIRVAEFGARNFHNPARLWPTKIQGIHGEVSDETLDKFLDEVRMRVFDVISYSNTRSYSFGGCFDLFGVSGFGIEIDREGTMGFLIPTFANSLFSPQLTSEQQHLNHIGQVFEQVFALQEEQH